MHQARGLTERTKITKQAPSSAVWIWGLGLTSPHVEPALCTGLVFLRTKADPPCFKVIMLGEKISISLNDPLDAGFEAIPLRVDNGTLQ